MRKARADRRLGGAPARPRHDRGRLRLRRRCQGDGTPADPGVADRAFLMARDHRRRARLFGRARRQRRASPSSSADSASPVGRNRQASAGRADPGVRRLYRWDQRRVDRTIRRTRLSAGITSLDESSTLLGGRFDRRFGTGGSSTLFLDLEARRDLGSGWSAALNARRGWTSFGAGDSPTRRLWFHPRQIAHPGRRRPARAAHRAAAAGRAGRHVALSPDRLFLRQPARVLRLASDCRWSRAGASWTANWPMARRCSVSRGWIGGNLFYRRQPGHIAHGRRRCRSGAPLLARFAATDPVAHDDRRRATVDAPVDRQEQLRRREFGQRHRARRAFAHLPRERHRGFRAARQFRLGIHHRHVGGDLGGARRRGGNKQEEHRNPLRRLLTNSPRR